MRRTRVVQAMLSIAAMLSMAMGNVQPPDTRGLATRGAPPNPQPPRAGSLIAAPTLVRASDGTYSDRVLVTWSAVSGATSYKVYRATTATGTKSPRGNPTGTSFNDTSAVPETTYYYWVVAYKDAMKSGYSAYNTGWRSVVSAPTGVKASDGTYADKVLVSWNAVSGATSYRVYRATSPTGTKSLLGSPTGTKFADTSATPKTTYYYWVVAYKNAKKSGYSPYNTGWRKFVAPGLRAMADQLGITVGIELDGQLFSNPTYQQIVKREFNLATIDSGIYWESSEPQKGQIVLSWPDEQLPFAQAGSMTIRGHPLVWVDNSNAWNSVPAWLLTSHFSQDEWVGILRNHVTQIVSHYRGQMEEWVVVNEADKRGLFQTHIGSDYLEIAFQAAREADPNATLIYNDFNNERPYSVSGYLGFNTPQTQEIVKRLRKRGLIDGVGLQMHIFDATHAPSKADMVAAMKSYGVPIYITECDVDLTGVSGTQTERFAYQAAIYARITDACIESGVCKSITFWGIGDKYSWLETYLNEPNADATLYNDNLQPKPAYYAVRNSLLKHLPQTTDTVPDDRVSEAEAVYDEIPLQMPGSYSGSEETEQQPTEMVSAGPSPWTCYDDNADPCNSALSSVEMVSASDAWAVGDGGLILHWDGSSWSRSPSPTTKDLRSVSVVSATNTWAVGFDGVILHWNGSAWAVTTSPTSSDFRSVHMISANDGWATAGSPRPSADCADYFHWNGSVWSKVDLNSCSGYAVDLAVRSATNILSVGLYGYGERWDGKSWSYAGPNTYKSLRSVAMSSDVDGWAVGDSGALLHWDGYGWAEAPSPANTDLFAVALISGTNGWAAGENGTILHWDGNTWALSPSPTNYDLNSITMLSGSDGWAVGYNTILHWDGSAWSTFKNPSPTIEDLTSVSLTSTSNGWAVGYGGKLLRWNGSIWSSFSSPTKRALHSIAIKSISEGWAVGSGGVILRWNGAVWARASSPTTRTLHAVASDRLGGYWAVGAGGIILRWNGKAWSKVPSPTMHDLTSVAVVSGTDAWAVGNGAWGFGATILHWNGTTWSSVTSPTSNSLSSVSMIDSHNGWTVGQGGRILRWNGNTWSAATSPTTRPLLAVRMVSATHGWAVGLSGTILHWNGMSWSTVPSPSRRALYGIALASSSTTGTWIVGSGGTILRYAGAAADE